MICHYLILFETNTGTTEIVFVSNKIHSVIYEDVLIDNSSPVALLIIPNNCAPQQHNAHGHLQNPG